MAGSLEGTRHTGGRVLGLIRVGVLPTKHVKKANHKETEGVCEGVLVDHGFPAG